MIIMKTSYNKFVWLIFLIIFFSFFTLASNVNDIHAASAKQLFQESLDKTAQGTGHKAQTSITSTKLPDLIGKLISYILAFVGVFFLLLMIYGGYIWMIARGNEQEVEKAKNTIIAAIIGLVIILLAYAITYMISSIWARY